MEEIRYHPLIDADGDGSELVPMFVNTNEDTVREHHRLYMEEMLPYLFRLISNGTYTATDADKALIHCPTCGRPLRLLGAAIDTHKLGLYVCDTCWKSES